MKKSFHLHLPYFKDPANKTYWLILGLSLLGLILMTAGYFSGKALYYYTH